MCMISLGYSWPHRKYAIIFRRFWACYIWVWGPQHCEGSKPKIQPLKEASSHSSKKTMPQTTTKDLPRVSFNYQWEYMSGYIRDNNRYGSHVLDIDDGENLALFLKGCSEHPRKIPMFKSITDGLQMVYFSSNWDMCFIRSILALFMCLRDVDMVRSENLGSRL